MATTPLVEYLLAQASSGTTPTVDNDTSTGTALNLTINYGAGGSWTAITAGNGRLFAAAGGDISAALNGTKVATALAGATKATLEVVCDTTANPSFGEIFGMCSNAFDEVFILSTGNPAFNVVTLNMGGNVVYSMTVTPGLHHLLFAVDMTQATAGNRILGYVDGVFVASTGGSVPAQNTAIDAGFTNYATNRIVIGCLTAAGVQAFNGGVYMARFYAATVGATETASNSTAFLANNDAAPAVGTVNPPFDQSPPRRPSPRLISPRQTEVPPQLGVKTGTGLPDVQGRVLPALRRFPTPTFESLPPMAVVAAPPPVNSPTAGRLISVPRPVPSTDVMPQAGVFTGAGLPGAQGAAVVPLRRFPATSPEVAPPLGAAPVAPPAVDSPAPARIGSRAAPTPSAEAFPQSGVFTGSGPVDSQAAARVRPTVAPVITGDALPPVVTVLPPMDQGYLGAPPARRRSAHATTDALPGPPSSPPPVDSPSPARAPLRVVRAPSGDSLPPLPPAVFGAILDIQPIRWFRGRVRQILHDVGWWPQIIPPVPPFRSPSKARIVTDPTTTTILIAVTPTMLTINADAQRLFIGEAS